MDSLLECPFSKSLLTRNAGHYQQVCLKMDMWTNYLNFSIHNCFFELWPKAGFVDNGPIAFCWSMSPSVADRFCSIVEFVDLSLFGPSKSEKYVTSIQSIQQSIYVPIYHMSPDISF